MTPSQGVSLRRLANGIPVLRVHFTADPTMTLERVAEMRTKYPHPGLFNRELNIEYEALEGERLFPEYSKDYNDLESLEPFDVWDPELWTIFHACDPHGRTPNTFLWEAINKHGDRIVCGELWAENPEGSGLRPHASEESCADIVKWIESDSESKPACFSWAEGHKLKIYKRVMDTHGSAINSESGGQDFFRTFSDLGLEYYKAHKSEQINSRSRSSLSRLLTPVAMTIGNETWMQPQLRIFRGCRELRAELEDARYPEGEILKMADEKPETYRKHAIDCLTYIESEEPRFVPQHGRLSAFKPLNPATGY